MINGSCLKCDGCGFEVRVEGIGYSRRAYAPSHELARAFGWKVPASSAVAGEALCPCCVEEETVRRHKQKLAELSEHCKTIEELVDGYFQPPNLMAISGEKWDLFVRRKGSDTEFGPSEWKGE